MLILALDATALAGSVALCENERLLAEFTIQTGNTHSETLLPMVESVLRMTGRAVDDIDLFACTQGPGSFTGVRIGVAAAKGFAWGREIPCFGVSTLEAMALSLGAYQGYVCPCMDARRSQVYNALFYVNQGQLERISEDRAISLTALGEELKNLKEPIFLVGDGSNLCYNTLLESVPNLVLPPEHRMHQRACGVALAARKQAEAGDPGDAAALTPNYLRLSQAERERAERMKAN